MLATAAVVLDRLLGFMRVGSLWLARLGGGLILATVVLVTIEILSRRFYGRSLVHSTELTGYVTAISTSWAFAYTLFCKAHIRIDALYLRFPQVVRAVLDLMALAVLALFCLLVVGAALDVAVSSWSAGSRANTPLQTPVWIPQFLWAFGMTWFSLAVAVLLLRVALALAGRDLETVQTLAGSPTIDEQVAAEAGSERS